MNELRHKNAPAFRLRFKKPKSRCGYAIFQIAYSRKTKITTIFCYLTTLFTTNFCNMTTLFTTNFCNMTTLFTTNFCNMATLFTMNFCNMTHFLRRILRFCAKMRVLRVSITKKAGNNVPAVRIFMLRLFADCFFSLSP